MQSHQMKRAAGNSAPTDPNFKQTVLLLHGDGTNGGQNNTFIDSSTNNFTITRNGNTTQGTFSPFSQSDGYWSNYFDGTGDYLSIADNAALDMGSSDFTIEGWYYPVGNAAVSTGIVSKRANSSTVGGVLLYYGSTGLTPSLLVDTGGTWGINIASSIAFNGNAWNHFAIVRNGTAFNLYINGVSGVSATSSATIPDNASDFCIGSAGGSTFPISTCYMSNFRVVKGTAVYTSAFTPPTVPLTAITNTSLLTCQSNRFKDNSSNAFTITSNGNTAVTAFSPFAPTAAYVASTNGGSAYFDGTGDYLSVADNAALEMGSSNFTIECWFYPLSLPADNLIADFGSQGTQASLIPFYCVSSSSSVVYYISSGGGAWNIASGVSFGGTLRMNQWHHLALVRNGNTYTPYFNGVAGTTTTSSSSINDSAVNKFIGSATTGTSAINGYLSSFRVVKGTAVYTAAFTPPTAPLTAITNTQLLCNFTNAAIFDNTGKNDLETVGNAQISTSVVKYGTGSMYFDGTGDWLLAPANPNWDFGSGDFAIELWLNPSSTTTTDAVVSKGIVSSTGNEVWTLQWYGTNTLAFFSGGGLGSPIVTTTSTFSTGTWYHVAVTRSSGTTRIFVNGTVEATSSTSYTITAGGQLYIGAGWFAPASRDTSGYIDDLRITKGVARYTANFTVPARAFPDK
jgi:hypothetical protein